MKPFLILQLRENDAAADGEFEAFLKYGELTVTDVHRVRMEKDELPDIDLETYSGVIVGGGPWNVSDALEKKSARQKDAEDWLNTILIRIVENDVPYLGACYGLGALTVSRGADVSKEQYGEPASAINVELTPEAADDPLLTNLPSVFRAFVGHKEACQALPVGAVWLASSATCPIQMYRLGKNVYATQFHPELDTEGVCVRIDAYKHAGYFPPEDAEALKATMREEKLYIPMEILKRFVQKYRSNI